MVLQLIETSSEAELVNQRLQWEKVDHNVGRYVGEHGKN